MYVSMLLAGCHGTRAEPGGDLLFWHMERVMSVATLAIILIEEQDPFQTAMMQLL
jgi:hypothetical protein